jgi:hypothetical protein
MLLLLFCYVVVGIPVVKLDFSLFRAFFTLISKEKGLVLSSSYLLSTSPRVIADKLLK